MNIKKSKSKMELNPETLERLKLTMDDKTAQKVYQICHNEKLNANEEEFLKKVYQASKIHALKAKVHFLFFLFVVMVTCVLTVTLVIFEVKHIPSIKVLIGWIIMMIITIKVTFSKQDDTKISIEYTEEKIK